MHAGIEEGNVNPLQYSCLENPRDRAAWWAAIYRVAQSWTWLKRLSSIYTLPLCELNLYFVIKYLFPRQELTFWCIFIIHFHIFIIYFFYPSNNICLLNVLLFHIDLNLLEFLTLFLLNRVFSKSRTFGNVFLQFRKGSCYILAIFFFPQLKLIGTLFFKSVLKVS